MPKAAELCRCEIMQGLDGDVRAALKARVFLREWFGRKPRLEPLAEAANGPPESEHCSTFTWLQTCGLNLQAGQLSAEGFPYNFRTKAVLIF